MGHMVETTGRSFDIQSRHCCEGCDSRRGQGWPLSKQKCTQPLKHHSALLRVLEQQA